MEIVIAWWWILNLLGASIVLYACYIAFFKYKFKNKKYNIIAAILIVLSFINPIKINGTNNVQVSNVQNLMIKSTKVLPKKISDNSFKENTLEATKDISEKEIWDK